MEEQINICVSCLSTNRHLVPVRKITPLLQEIHFRELQESPGGVCWECRSILTKFYRLKTRAKIAQKTLLHSREHLNIKSLTTLSKTSTLLEHTYDFVSTVNCDKELKLNLDSIKEENVDQSDDVKGQTDDNLAKNNENLDQIDDSLDDTLVIDEDRIEKPEKYENFYVEADQIENKYHDQLFGEREYFFQDGKGTVHGQKNDDLNSKTKARDVIDEDFQEKFAQVVMSEEEMARVRDEKRKQPSFRILPYKCDGCVLGFRKEEKFRNHIKKKHDESIGCLICDVCGVRFPHNLALIKHKRKHYVVYRCKICKYQSNNLRSSLKHCKIKHAADKLDRIHCSQCHFVAKSPQELEEHKELKHLFWCNECGEKFTLKTNIRIHMTRTHAPKRAFKCDICKKGFNTKMQLESHLSRHDDNYAKKLAFCEKCNIQFKNIIVYRSHLRNTANHSDGYTCLQCNKIFTTLSYLKRHSYNHHNSTDLTPYKCEICNKTFMSKIFLRRHQETHLVDTRPRKYSCNLCTKTFYNSTVLRNHSYIHSDERKYTCQDCGNTYKQPSCLYAHMRLKHNVGGQQKKRGSSATAGELVPPLPQQKQ